MRPQNRRLGIATIGNAAKILWCTCCLAVLVVTLWNEDAGCFFLVTMMALTFPICIGVTYLITAALIVTDMAALPNDWVVTFVGWALFVIAGYVQCFILVPAMLDRTPPISIFGTRDEMSCEAKLDRSQLLLAGALRELLGKLRVEFREADRYRG